MKVADKGISTINERYSMVYPRVRPNPGITERLKPRRACIAVPPTLAAPAVG
jgi:hypothetical protein